MKFKITELPKQVTNGWNNFYFYKWLFKVERAEWYRFLLKVEGEKDLLFQTKEEAEKYIQCQLNPSYYP